LTVLVQNQLMIYKSYHGCKAQYLKMVRTGIGNMLIAEIILNKNRFEVHHG
jgi:hypothetical protein